MKLKYIIAAIASAAVLAGCQTEPMVGSFEDFNLDKTFISIPLTGGTTEVNLTAPEDWSFVSLFDLKDENGKVVKDENNNNVKTELPEWLTVNKVSGTGSTTLSFTAPATESGREAELQIKGATRTLFLVVRQGSVEAEEATCAEVIAGPDGKSYIVKGSVTSIVNTTYGNWYLRDEAGDEVYIYGTLDKDGKTKNFLSLGIEVGDVVKVSGPKTTYNGTVELVDVTVLSIEKALLGFAKVEESFDKEGGKIDFTITYKGKGVYANVAEDAKEWISQASSSFSAGIPTLFEKNPADTAFFTFNVAPNLGYNGREGIIEFVSSSLNDKNQTISTSMPYTVSQDPMELDGHLFELATKIEDGETYVLVTPSGKMMTNISGSYGNPAAADVDVYMDQWVITLSSTYNYTFEAVEGGYNIKQDDSRYIYQTGTYTNFNAAAEIPEGAAGVFTAEAQEDGTFTITCVDKENVLGYNASKNNFECSKAAGLEGVVLYKYVRSEGSVLKTYSYRKATSGDLTGKAVLLVGLKDGKYYAATPVSSDYGYPAGFEVTANVEEDVITLKSTDYQWILASAGDGKVKLQQPDGRYGYCDGSHASFQIAAADAEDSLVAHTLSANTDGTWTITCVANNYQVRHGDGTYTTFGYYAAEGIESRGTAPQIYVLEEE